MNDTPASGRTRVFVVDDHALVREWLQHLLRREPDLLVVGQAEDASAALAAMVQNPPDVAVVDLALKKGSGLELIKELRAQLPDVEVVVLSMHDRVTDVERAFRAGATGYVMKRESTGQIVAAIRQVRVGGVFANPAILAELHARFAAGIRGGASPLDVLSDREVEVFRRLGAGESTREIAEALGLRQSTVQTYCSRMKEKLGAADAHALQRVAIREHEARAPGSATPRTP